MKPFELAWSLLKAENLDHYKNIMGAEPGHDLDRYPPAPALGEAQHLMTQQEPAPFSPESPSTSHDDIAAHIMDLVQEGQLPLELANHIFERLSGMHDAPPEGGRDMQAVPAGTTVPPPSRKVSPNLPDSPKY